MTRWTLAAIILIFAGAGRPATAENALSGTQPEAEFHMGRLVYNANYGRPGWREWWAIDYPEAEYHLVAGLRRLTRINVADDSRHLALGDDALFDYPWLFAQQVGRWRLDDDEISRLREYLQRGGFLLVDDFHGPGDWEIFRATIDRVLPDWPIRDITESDVLMHVHYDLKQDTQIPGRRHLRRGPGGGITAYMTGGPPHWRGIYDPEGRLVVAINFNMDMGDAWEHADDPDYPVPMTSLAYRFAVNYLVYAMTH